MTWVSRGIGLVSVLALVTTASAQDDLDKGKTPEQLYAANCAICHKSPRGLGSGGGILGVENFLREHYTANPQSAAAIARYLRSVDQASPPDRKRAAKPAAVEGGKDKPAEKKSTTRAEPKAGDLKADESKTGKKDDKTDAGKRKKPAEAKRPKSKPMEGMENNAGDADKPKADDTKPPEGKPADVKPAEAKPKAAKPPATKPKAAATERKPTAPASTDSKTSN